MSPIRPGPQRHSPLAGQAENTRVEENQTPPPSNLRYNAAQGSLRGNFGSKRVANAEGVWMANSSTHITNDVDPTKETTVATSFKEVLQENNNPSMLDTTADFVRCYQISLRKKGCEDNTTVAVPADSAVETEPIQSPSLDVTANSPSMRNSTSPAMNLSQAPEVVKNSESSAPLVPASEAAQQDAHVPKQEVSLGFRTTSTSRSYEMGGFDKKCQDFWNSQYSFYEPNTSKSVGLWSSILNSVRNETLNRTPSSDASLEKVVDSDGKNHAKRFANDSKELIPAKESSVVSAFQETPFEDWQGNRSVHTSESRFNRIAVGCTKESIATWIKTRNASKVTMSQYRAVSALSTNECSNSTRRNASLTEPSSFNTTVETTFTEMLNSTDLDITSISEIELKRLEISLLMNDLNSKQSERPVLETIRELVRLKCDSKLLKEAVSGLLSDSSGSTRRSEYRIFKGYEFSKDVRWYCNEPLITEEKPSLVPPGPKTPPTFDVTVLEDSPSEGDIKQENDNCEKDEGPISKPEKPSAEDAKEEKPKNKKTVRFEPEAVLFSELSSAEPDFSLCHALIKGLTRVNQRNARGVTLLHLAVLQEKPKLVLRLLKAGANANAVDDDHWTPLHIAVLLDMDSPDEQLRVVRMLLLHGASPFLRCRPLPKDNVLIGSTALELFESRGNGQLIESALTFAMARISKNNFGRGHLFLIIPYILRKATLQAGTIVRVLKRNEEDERVLCEWESNGITERGWLPFCFLSPAPPSYDCELEKRFNKDFSTGFREHEEQSRALFLLQKGATDLLNVHSQAKRFSPADHGEAYDDDTKSDQKDNVYNVRIQSFLDALNIRVSSPALGNLDTDDIRFLKIMGHLKKFLFWRSGRFYGFEDSDWECEEKSSNDVTGNSLQSDEGRAEDRADELGAEEEATCE